jgi:hypothetical protein
VSRKNLIERTEIIVVGSGLSALNFADTYLEKKKKLDIISPNFKTLLGKNISVKKNFLPSQMKGETTCFKNFLFVNNLDLNDNCKILGSLNFGGLSNYWGLQIDNYINKNLNNLNNKTIKEIKDSFIEFLRKYKPLGSFSFDKKKLYENSYSAPLNLEKLENKKFKDFNIEKPIIAFSKNKKNNKNILNKIDENLDKIDAKNFLLKSKKNKKIIFHNYYVDSIEDKKNYVKLLCKNKTTSKIILAKKVVFATGTIATTKIIMNYLNFKKEVKIKHHPRIVSVFFSKSKIKSKLNFTPSLMQIISKNKKNYFTADLRPGNKFITDSIIELSSLLYPLKFLINFFRERLLFSNVLLDSSFSNIYIKKKNFTFSLYSKKKKVKKNLYLSVNKIYQFLLKQKIIYPFYKAKFTGFGSDFHYFGTIPFNNRSILSVTNNCELKSNKKIHIVDGSVFDFKFNKYPIGIIIANARRIGKLLSK